MAENERTRALRALTERLGESDPVRIVANSVRFVIRTMLDDPVFVRAAAEIARSVDYDVTVGGTLGIVPADFLMSRDHLLGVKRRAETLERGGLPGADHVGETR